MSEPIVRAEEICKYFGGVKAVNNFSMVLRKGEIKGIIGPNGAGKTTIFNCFSGIYKLDKGDLYFCGERINDISQEDIARKGLARTFQNARLYSGLSVLGNVKSAVDWTGNYNILQALLRTPMVRREEKRIEEQAIYCLETANLAKYAKMRPNNLPYGVQRRVEIARALASQPKVLMLDEPAAGLNPEEVFELIDFINDIKKNFDLSLLIIEHKMDVIMNLCDYIYVQDFGNTIAAGTTDEIQNDPIVLAAYLGEVSE